MLFIADFHIHSRYSYATSKTMDLQALATWGQLKGIAVMGTGDFTHPVWRKELHQQLMPHDDGLFTLQPHLQADVDAAVYTSCRQQQRFLLTAEIATIFRRNGRCYKTHSIIFAPSLEVAEKISNKLATIGNIAYDGRPILSLDVKDLLKIVLDISPDCMLIPAHIWTPHFGLLGSKSGFNSFQECFEELTDHIYAFEKGLSSNFLMNAQLSDLDRFAILCNSDAHSVQNLGREANLFDTSLSYKAITDALKTNDRKALVAGIEFFPEMGKYYGSGHRNCGIYVTPEESLKNQICPVCHKPITIGVAHRVAQLADRTVEQAKKQMRSCYRIAPLQEIIAINLQTQSSSKKVQQLYQHVLASVGNEFYILLQADIAEIAKYSNHEIAQSINLVRHGHVQLTPGYDGIYGMIQF
ncbi:MAG: DNA helicase UvrD [Candidatus Dependentiae bacterium]|nr:DNA helicase UvrD [Candidatus Dependentiae bacterium]